MSIQFVDDVRDLLAQTFGLDVEAYTSLTTVEDETCFVTKAGGLMTALHLRGHLRVVGADELALLSDQLLSLLGSALAAGESHFIDLVYSSDPARTPAAIRRLLRPGTCTAERVGLDLRDLFAERERHLPAYTCAETAYLIVWTTPAGLPRATRRQSARERRRELARLPEKPALARDNQNPFATNRYLTDAHRSLVKTLLNDLAAAGFELSALPVAGAARRMREECDPGWTPDDWTPLLPGAATPAPRARADGSLAASGCWYPALGQQLIPRGIEIVDYRTVRVGDRLYQPFYIDVPQLTEMQRFERLLDRARRQGLPWRIAFRLSGGTAEWLAARRVWTSLLHFAGATNKLTDAALQALRRYLHEGHVGVKVQTALTTWVDLSEPAPPGRGHLEELRARAAHLAAHVQSWGGCTVRETTGHPVKAWVSTLPGVSQINVATCYAAPLAEVLRTLPLFRPASLWEAGAIVFRSRDGRLFAYQPGSAWQGTWNDLYYARPGSGKSVTMALVNLALILSPGFRELPFVRVIDIGPSSEGLVSLVREALPPARRFEAQFHAPSNDARWAINPLDTPLGLRRPPPGQRAFLVSFLSQLATAPGAIEPPEGVADMAGLVVDLAYEHYGDPKAPKPYAPAQDSAVDEALARHRVALPDRPSWWEVVDALFDAGDVPAAVRAQRHAVPLLSDLVAVAQSPQVAHIYGNEMSLSGTAESPVALFNRVISAATREWPILAYPSRFDLGNARVASLDVADDHLGRRPRPGRQHGLQPPRPRGVDLHGGHPRLRGQAQQQRAVAGGRFQQRPPRPQRAEQRPGGHRQRQRRGKLGEGQGVGAAGGGGREVLGQPPRLGERRRRCPWRRPRPKMADAGRLQRFAQRVGRHRVPAGRHGDGPAQVEQVARAELFVAARPPQKARRQVGQVAVAGQPQIIDIGQRAERGRVTGRFAVEVAVVRAVLVHRLAPAVDAEPRGVMHQVIGGARPRRRGDGRRFRPRREWRPRRIAGRGPGGGDARRGRRHDARDGLARQLAHGRVREVPAHVGEFQGRFGVDDVALAGAPEAQGRQRGGVGGHIARRHQRDPLRGKAQGVQGDPVGGEIDPAEAGGGIGRFGHAASSSNNERCARRRAAAGFSQSASTREAARSAVVCCSRRIQSGYKRS